MTDEGILALFGGAYIFGLIFVLILVVHWFLLPFAIFVTKDRLDTLIRETQRTNALLEQSQMSARVESALATPSFNADPAFTVDSDPILNAEPANQELAKAELMKKYDIHKDGDKYRFLRFSYDRLEDAVVYARKHLGN